LLGFGLALLLIEFAFPHLGWDARDMLVSVMTGAKHEIATEQHDSTAHGDRTGSIIRANARRASANAVTVWQYTVRPSESTTLMQCQLQRVDRFEDMLRFKSGALGPRIAPAGHQAAQL
jgi:hypothetical protein